MLKAFRTLVLGFLCFVPVAFADPIVTSTVSDYEPGKGYKYTYTFSGTDTELGLFISAFYLFIPGTPYQMERYPVYLTLPQDWAVTPYAGISPIDPTQTYMGALVFTTGFTGKPTNLSLILDGNSSYEVSFYKDEEPIDGYFMLARGIIGSPGLPNFKPHPAPIHGIVKVPYYTSSESVPEPGALALSIVGFTLIGLACRRNRKKRA